MSLQSLRITLDVLDQLKFGKMMVSNTPAEQLRPSLTTIQPQQGGTSYPSSVNPYPHATPPPPGPAAGPGSGFPPRSGLAGMQPHSMSPAPGMNMSPGTGSGIRGGLPEEKNVAQMVKENTNVYARKFQALLDRSTPHVMERWLVTGALSLLFALSVILRQGVSPKMMGFGCSKPY